MPKRSISSITALTRSPRIEFILRTGLYCAILITLVMLYASGAGTDAQFVYINF